VVSTIVLIWEVRSSTIIGIKVFLKKGMNTDAIFETRDPESLMSMSSGLMSIATLFAVIFGATSVAGVPGWVDRPSSISAFNFLMLIVALPETVTMYLYVKSQTSLAYNSFATSSRALSALTRLRLILS